MGETKKPPTIELPQFVEQWLTTIEPQLGQWFSHRFRALIRAERTFSALNNRLDILEARLNGFFEGGFESNHAEEPDPLGFLMARLSALECAIGNAPPQRMRSTTGATRLPNAPAQRTRDEPPKSIVRRATRDEADAIRMRLLETNERGGASALEAERYVVACTSKLTKGQVSALWSTARGKLGAAFVARMLREASPRDDERATLRQTFQRLYRVDEETIMEWYQTVYPPANGNGETNGDTADAHIR